MTTRALCYLITGATGSLGTALTRRLLPQGHKVRAFARNEHSHERLIAALPAKDRPRLSSIVGDVRDIERLRLACDGVDVVIHAAAMKVIPLCEYNPQEAVATNVMGSANVARAVIDCDVSRAVLVSTDKARSPSTHYGSCKLAAERLWLASNALCGARPHPFVGVVYGNVFGSQGSILHTFREQSLAGRITITDARCTRFHITLAQAVDLVLSVVDDARPGEIWIPKIPSYRVVDFAEAIAPGLPHKVIGLRANEKVHELLISEDEAPYAREENGHYVMTPGVPAESHVEEVHSGRNPWKLSIEAIREEIVRFDREFEGVRCG